MCRGASMEKGQCVPGEGTGSLLPSVSPALLRQNLGLVRPPGWEQQTPEVPCLALLGAGAPDICKKNLNLLHRLWNQNSRLHVCTISSLGCRAISPAHERSSRRREVLAPQPEYRYKDTSFRTDHKM